MERNKMKERDETTIIRPPFSAGWAGLSYSTTSLMRKRNGTVGWTPYEHRYPFYILFSPLAFLLSLFLARRCSV
jgi:hypothetical protein